MCDPTTTDAEVIVDEVVFGEGTFCFTTLVVFASSAFLFIIGCNQEEWLRLNLMGDSSSNLF